MIRGASGVPSSTHSCNICGGEVALRGIRTFFGLLFRHFLSSVHVVLEMIFMFTYQCNFPGKDRRSYFDYLKNILCLEA